MGFSGCSSGAIAVNYLQTLYERVFIYGFDFFQGDEHHYGDNVGRGKLHKPQHELVYFMRLILEGKIIPFSDYLGADIIDKAKAIVKASEETDGA